MQVGDRVTYSGFEHQEYRTLWTVAYIDELAQTATIQGRHCSYKGIPLESLTLVDDPDREAFQLPLF